MNLRLEPASNAFLPANSTGIITQMITVTNNMHGEVPTNSQFDVVLSCNNEAIPKQKVVMHMHCNK